MLSKVLCSNNNIIKNNSFINSFLNTFNIIKNFYSKNNNNIIYNNNNIIGIDLGTTNSCVAIMEGNSPKIIENSEGMRTTPSIVAFNSNNNNNKLVGILAKRQILTNPLNTFYATKRLIGRKFNDPETQKNIKNLSYKVIKNPNNDDAWLSTSSNQFYSPTQIGGFILEKMKDSAEKYLNKKITDAVITVPAYFNDSQRQSTKDAGKLAGLNVVRIINEPTAAALAYGLHKNNNKNNKKIAVYDLGGGTFDISILELSNGIFEVKATNGDTNLGGEDFDNLLLKFVLGKFKEKNPNINIFNDKIALQRIKEACEKAKIELSSSSFTNINLPFISHTLTSPIHFNLFLSRTQFESMMLPLIKKTLKPCMICLKDSGFKKAEIDNIILVGGMTRMPLIQSTLKNFYGKSPNHSVNPDEAVALGAAIQGGILKGEIKDMLLLDVTPLSLGIETIGGIFSRIINRNTTIPIKKTQIFSTAVDNQNSVIVKVFQGEREMVLDNKFLGQFDLNDIPPAPKGIPQIEVTFDIDANGIVNVSAKEKHSGKNMGITIHSNSGLNEEQIKNMIEIAKKMKEKDLIKKKIAELKNEGDGIIYVVKKQIEENEKKIGKKNVNEIKNIIKEFNEVCDGNNLNVDKIKNILNKLKNSVKKIGKI